MTVFPQKPSLIECSGKPGFMVLSEPHLTFVRLGLGFSLAVLLEKGYFTDGATVPKKELENSGAVRKICSILAKRFNCVGYKDTLEYLIGSPFEMPRILAAIVHDGLYDIKWKFRWLCDRVYRNILSSMGYDHVRLEIEYTGIRMLGWRNWDDVSRSHVKEMKKYVRAEVIRSSMEKEVESAIRAAYDKMD